MEKLFVLIALLLPMAAVSHAEEIGNVSTHEVNPALQYPLPSLKFKIYDATNLHLDLIDGMNTDVVPEMRPSALSDDVSVYVTMSYYADSVMWYQQTNQIERLNAFLKTSEEHGYKLYCDSCGVFDIGEASWIVEDLYKHKKDEIDRWIQETEEPLEIYSIALIIRRDGLAFEKHDLRLPLYMGADFESISSVYLTGQLVLQDVNIETATPNVAIDLDLELWDVACRYSNFNDIRDRIRAYAQQQNVDLSANSYRSYHTGRVRLVVDTALVNDLVQYEKEGHRIAREEASLSWDSTPMGWIPLGASVIQPGSFAVYQCRNGKYTGCAMISIEKYNEPNFKSNRFRKLRSLKLKRVANLNKTANTDLVYSTAHVSPEFPGGYAALYRYVKKHIKYPEEALANGILGRVSLSFTVEKDGSVSDLQILQSPDEYLSEAVMEVGKSMPRWTPGRIEGKPIRMKCLLPIIFRK